MKAGAIQRFSERAAAVGAELWPALVEIGGATYEATVPEPRPSFPLEEGGEVVAGELTARVRLDLLQEKPEEQTELRWKRPDEAEWRPEAWVISLAKRSPLDAEWMLTCGPKN